MKQNENVISLVRIFNENSLTGIGDDEGKQVSNDLVCFIDKKPEYKVDEFGGYLYYKLNDKTIYAYDLNN